MRKIFLSVIALLLVVGVAACAQREKPAVPTPTLSAQPALPASATETPVVIPTAVTPRASLQATQPITSTTPRATTQATLPPNFIATAGPPPLATPTRGVAPVTQPTNAPVIQPTIAPLTQPSNTPEPQPVAGGGACTNPYIVGRGEWAYQIARKCGTTFGALQAANPSVNLAVVYAGQRLNLSGGGSTPPGGTSGGGRTYMVRPGDTLFGIAARYGTTAYAIQLANRLANPNFIYVGQVLRIP